jgi:isochorismate synthase
MEIEEQNEVLWRINEYDREEVIRALIGQGKRLAIYRLPDQQEEHWMIGLQETVQDDDFVLENLPEGFLFAPFEPSAEHKVLFFKADVHLVASHEPKCTGRPFKQIKAESDAIDHFLAILKEATPEPGHPASLHAQPSPGQAHYVDMVQKACAEIGEGRLEKVVLARRQTYPLPINFKMYSFIRALSNAYAHAFVSFVYGPDCGPWFGASPEVLLSVSEQGIFHTTALAGTQAYSHTMLSDISWTQKEIEEQAMVSRYIVNCFKQIRLREFDEEGPRTAVAGNLLHLKTDFYVDMDKVGFPQLPGVMLRLLHPTSAVCGSPKASALQFIQSHEGFDRQYFSGYLGPVNTGAGSTQLFVNLRCMNVVETWAVLYAGAGITGNSNPEKEWDETELKMQTLLSVMKK